MSAATYEASPKNLKEKYVRNGMALGTCNLGEFLENVCNVRNIQIGNWPIS